jgi:exonuclease III
MIEWTALSERLLIARFQAQSSMTITVVAAYAPTETSSSAEQQAFDLQLHAALAAVPGRDVVVLLGDFNAQIGSDCSTHGQVRGPHTVQPVAANSNGSRLLDTALAHNLVIANTLFPHKRIHMYTHVAPAAPGQQGLERVLDYILFSKRFRSSIRDCRVFRGVDLDSDHRLLVMTLQLRFSSSRGQQRQ